MPPSTINVDKELVQSFQPLLLIRITLVDGTVLRWSTHSLDSSKGGFEYGGFAWEARIVNQKLAGIQALSNQGIDITPNVNVEVADPDGNIWAIEESTGFKGAIMEALFLFYDAGSPETGGFSTDSPIPIKYKGICDPAVLQSAKILSINSVSALNMSQVQLPFLRVQKRCPWVFPQNKEQRVQAALSPDSVFFRCGYSPDVTDSDGPGGSAAAVGNYESGTAAFTSCTFTESACVARLGDSTPSGGAAPLDKDTSGRTTGRFGGIQFQPSKQGGRSRSFLSGKWEDITNAGSNEAKYHDFVPLCYGTTWVDPLVLSVVGDANYTAFECLVSFGRMHRIHKVVVNDHEVQMLTDNEFPGSWSPPPGGSLFTNAITNDFRNGYWKTVSNGGRSGQVSALPFYDGVNFGKGDPYGSMCVLYVTVLRQLVSSDQVPRVRILVEGPRLRVYSDLNTFSEALPSENPAWILLDILRWSGWEYSEIDVQSFIDAASVCDENIEFFNQYGQEVTTFPNGQAYKRFAVSLSIRQRRSVREIVRGILNAIRGNLYVGDDGLLSLSIRGTLAEQQGSPVAGSNDVDPQGSKLYDLTPASGYVAYAFDDSNIIKEDSGETTLSVDQSGVQETPNKLSIEFQNKENEYSQDSVTIVDSEDFGRIGNEVQGNFQVEGVNTFDHLKRVVATWSAENYRGNPRLDSQGSLIGDTGGSLVYSFRTTFKAVHLRIGQICSLESQIKQISKRFVRVIGIAPSRNYESLELRVKYHNDNHYVDDYGQEDQPIFKPNFRDKFPRPSFPWQANQEFPVAGDAYFGTTDGFFSIRQTYEIRPDTSALARPIVGGVLPVNDVCVDPGPPRLDPIATTESTGGVFPGGRTYFIVVCAKSASGSSYQISAPSNTARVVVPSGTNTNKITAIVPFWDSNTQGYVVFIGTDPDKMSAQIEVDGSTPATIPIDTTSFPSYTSYKESSWGTPDVELDRISFVIRKVWHSGVLAQQIISVTSTTITLSVFPGHGFTTNQFAGYEATVLGVVDGADGTSTLIPIATFSITANDDDTLTVSGPNPQTCVGGATLVAGDVLVIRSKPVFGSDGSGKYVEDALWVNVLNPTLAPYTVTNATNATPIVVTIETEVGETFPFSNDQVVVIADVLGNSAANGGFVVKNVNAGAKTFELYDYPTGTTPVSGSGTYTSGGIAMRQLQGLTVNEEAGRYVRVIAGKGRGTRVPIKSNTATRIYINGDWIEPPDSTTRIIVEDSVEQASKEVTQISNDVPLQYSEFYLDMENLGGHVVLVEPVTWDGGGSRSYPTLASVRELYLYGSPGDRPDEEVDPGLTLPGDVQSLALVSAVQDSQDPTQVRITLSYNAPSTLNGFDGVDVQLEAPDSGDDPVLYTSGKIYPQGWHLWTANPGSIILRLPYPSRAERWYVYAPSRNQDGVNPLVHRSQPSPTPYVQVDVPKKPGGGGTAAPNVTGVTATPGYHTIPRARVQTKRFDVLVSWTLPTAHADYSNLAALRVVLVNNASGIEEYQVSGAIPVDRSANLPTSHRTAMFPAPDSVKTLKARVYAINENGAVSGSPAESATFVVGPLPDAPGVIAPTVVNVGYQVQGEEAQFRFEMTWTLDTGHADFDDGYHGVEIQARPTGSGAEWSILAIEDDPVVARNTGWFRRPKEDALWDVRFVPYNPKGVRNLSEAFTVSSISVLGASTALNVTGFTASRKTSYNEVGAEMFGFQGSWTLPSDPNLSHVEVVAVLSGETHEHILAIEGGGSTSFNTSFWPAPETSKTYTIYAYAVNHHGKRTPAPPNQNVVVTPAGTGDLRLHRARGSSVGPGLNLTGTDLRFNPGSGLELSGATARVDVGAGMGFSGNDLRISVLGVVNEMLASGAVTGAKILANSIGAVHAVFQTAAIQNADVASLQVNKLTAGSLNVQVSVVTGGSVIAQSGSNIARMQPGSLELQGSSTTSRMNNGQLTVVANVGALQGQLVSTGVILNNSSGFVVGRFHDTLGYGQVEVYTSAGSLRAQLDQDGLKLTSCSVYIGGTQTIDSVRNAFLTSVTVGGVAAISAARHGDFNQLRARQRMTFDEITSNTSVPNWQWRIPVNDEFGFIGWLKVSNT